jgi:uncharacterized protein YciI
VAAHHDCVLCVTWASVAEPGAHKERVYAGKNAALSSGSGRTVTGMYIVMLAYTAPREEIDYLLPDHIEWLTRHYEAGHFLCSGRQPRQAGRVIITRPMPRARLEAMLATDPLDVARMVRHEVVEFEATRTAPELHRVNEALAS